MLPIEVLLHVARILCALTVVTSISLVTHQRMLDRKMKKFWPGKNVILTGCSSGIGREMALMLADLGANVVLVARRGGLLEKVAQECRDRIKARGHSTKVVPVQADQGVAEDCERIVQTCISTFGGVDVLALDAAAQMYAYYEDHPDPIKTAREIMEVNYFGALRLFHLSLGSLKARHGTLLQVSSLAGKAGTPYTTFYAASKAALSALYDALRFECEGKINFCVAYPGFIATAAALRHQGEDRIGEAMHPLVCARKCLETAAAGYDDRYLPLVGKLLLPLKHFLPSVFKAGVRSRMPSREQHKRVEALWLARHPETQ
ncbi:putative Short chain dehydrogenase [Paratrimastix pyriformis]|uniref:Short chain dehydrogenase n=1 Tax=Paratrimastix pyriformis TaxID=342808 RepID=A0ABQ8UN79_9EUKA|nr:putative Short chain dehydrogenase [Paratrimastix pyriformis]|eukprot:GAFH01003180.1.p1 GENE.GAFH01003180.1~~GAFH01003180.1.p1  ORF type:complete len:318 (-),score=98.25 GAFH01003180.1:4-957(-)